MQLGRGALDTVHEVDGTYAFDRDKLNAIRPGLEQDVQSGILLANGCLRSAYIFIRFSGGPAVGRAFVRSLLEGLVMDGSSSVLRIARLGEERSGSTPSGRIRGTSARENQLVVNLALTAQGYKSLGHDPAVFGQTPFTEGSRSAEVIERLHDSVPLDWEEPYQSAWDALLILGHDQAAVLEQAKDALVDHLQRTGVVRPWVSDERRIPLSLRRARARWAHPKRPFPRWGERERGESLLDEAWSEDIHVELGNVLDQEGKLSESLDEQFELFGFRDGISQPIFLEEHWESVRPLQYGDAAVSPTWDPRCPLGTILARDPFGTRFSEASDPTRFGLGSFFVFRKLEQDYLGFAVRQAMYEAELRNRRAHLEQLYASKGGDGHAPSNPYAHERTADAERFVLTSLMGRERSGTPLLPSEAVVGAPERRNAFDFSSDRGGNVCPFASHVRKANPRGTTGDLARERSRRIARRGMPYGLKVPPGSSQLKQRAGLLFVCAQADIRHQFEFIQSKWLNGKLSREDLPTPGIDRLVGQAIPASVHRREGLYGSAFGRKESGAMALQEENLTDRSLRRAWLNQTLLMNFDFQDYVELRGAEYLFAPSLSGLRAIADQ